MSQKYIVYAPAYSANSGGAIFMHNLVHVLNEIGQTAWLWPMKPIYNPGLRGRIKAVLNPLGYAVDPNLNTPVAKRRDLTPDTIVVYPEIVPGNPLGARHVARWLLYKPGELHSFDFGIDEMFFRVDRFSDLPDITGGAPDLYVWRRNRVYRNENRFNRSGVCFMVRKGYDKSRIPETEDGRAIQVDGMNHGDLNEIFNRSKTFISYDEATMYSQFAAICGCDSVIVPGVFASHDEWVNNHPIGCYGVAYGFEMLPHARATRDRVLGLLDDKEAESIDTVRNFVALTKQHFGL